MIRRANQRATLYMRKSSTESLLFQLGKAIRMHIPLYRVMLLRRLQVLTESKNRNSCLTNIVHRSEDLIVNLSQPEHDTRFSRHSAISYQTKHRQTTVVRSTAAHDGR